MGNTALKPAIAPLLLGAGCGLVIAAMFVHLLSPVAAPPSTDPADGQRAVAAPADGNDDDVAAATQHNPATAVAEEREAGQAPAAEPPADETADADDLDVAASPPASPHMPAVPDVITVTIPDGASGATVAQLLREAGVIRDEDTFIGLMRERQATTRLRAGAYSFGPGEQLEAVLERLVAGKTALPDPVP